MIMYYKSMQSQAREKHQQLQREAQLHRQVRASRAQKRAPWQPGLAVRLTSRLATSMTSGIRRMAMSFRGSGRAVRRYISQKASAAFS
jgi:hypothetical protein